MRPGGGVRCADHPGGCDCRWPAVQDTIYDQHGELVGFRLPPRPRPPMLCSCGEERWLCGGCNLPSTCNPK